jgi:hypothetical protein
MTDLKHEAVPGGEMPIFKTTVAGLGPWCVDFADGEIVTCRTEARAKSIAGITEPLPLNFTLSNITPHVTHTTLWCWECRTPYPAATMTSRLHKSGLTVFTCSSAACRDAAKAADNWSPPHPSEPAPVDEREPVEPVDEDADAIIPGSLFRDMHAAYQAAPALLAREKAAGEEIARLRMALELIASAPAWGAPERWETTPAEVRQLARAALSADGGGK